MAWNAWLSDVFARQRQHLATVPRLLNDLQTQVIWESIISEDSRHLLLSSAQAARSALRSWQLIHQYQIPIELLDHYDHEEVRAFAHWIREYQQYMRQGNLIDGSQLPAWIRQKNYVPDRELHLTGFDQLTPIMQMLIDDWRAQGCHVHIDPMPSINHQVQAVAMKDQEEEWQFAARWARHQVEHGRSRVGVVVANLEANAAQVNRIFSGVLAPASRSVLAEFSAPVSIYASASLQSYPLIHQALQCLQLLNDDDGNAWSQYLRSPFIAGYELEASHRALLDNALRKSGQDEINVTSVSHMAMSTCPLLGALLQAASTYKEELGGKVLPSEWVARMTKILSLMGWAQGRPLSSDEHQCRQKFQEVLARLSGLDEVVGRVEFAAARHLLVNAVRQTRFAPESDEAAVIIIDAETATGMHFDALWISGVHAGEWPPPPQPDPFIPIDLQYKHQLPMSRAETCLKTATRKLQRLVGSANDVVISWPQHDDDVELRASALITWPMVAIDAIPRSRVGTLTQSMYQSRPMLESFSDAQFPPHPGGTIKQGSRVIELQSRCAFKAQAELRLFAESPEPTTPGIATHDRGRFIHRVLQDVWQDLRDYNGLRMALDREDTLRARVYSIADRVSQSQFSATTSHRQKLIQIEVTVATDIIMLLLQEESRRQPFTVQRNEERELFDIAGLTLRIQPDRIDGLADGKQMLIDYKTGDGYRVKDWLDIDEPGRPRSPQLPLYALAHASQLSGIAYAVLAPGTAELRGLADRNDIAIGVTEYGKGRSRNKLSGVETWSQLLDHWRSVIRSLAEAFMQGNALINPLKNECKYCMLTGLCRIKEQQLIDSDDDDD